MAVNISKVGSSKFAMKSLSHVNRSLALALLAAVIFAGDAQAVPRPIVPEPALKLHFASHQPKYTVKLLPSGKKMKLHFVLLTVFLVVAHVAMVFGMVDPTIMGWSADNTMGTMQHNM